MSDWERFKEVIEIKDWKIENSKMNTERCVHEFNEEEAEVGAEQLSAHLIPLGD